MSNQVLMLRNNFVMVTGVANDKIIVTKVSRKSGASDSQNVLPKTWAGLQKLSLPINGGYYSTVADIAVKFGAICPEKAVSAARAAKNKAVKVAKSLKVSKVSKAPKIRGKKATKPKRVPPYKRVSLSEGLEILLKMGDDKQKAEIPQKKRAKKVKPSKRVKKRHVPYEFESINLRNKGARGKNGTSRFKMGSKEAV